MKPPGGSSESTVMWSRVWGGTSRSPIVVSPSTVVAACLTPVRVWRVLLKSKTKILLFQKVLFLFFHIRFFVCVLLFFE